MKIACHCGAMIFGVGDSLPNKWHLIPDAVWFDLLETIEDAIVNRGHSLNEKEAACMRVRKLIGDLSRQAWQCQACGRVFVDDAAGNLQSFQPEPSPGSNELFRGRNR